MQRLQLFGKRPNVVILWSVAVILGILCWPLTLLVVLQFVKTLSKQLLPFSDDLTIKLTFTGVQITVKRSNSNDEQIEQNNASSEYQSNTQSMNIMSTPSRFDGKHILWVDDRPSSFTIYRHALEELGLRFTIATSTEDALEQVELRRFDVIISDMGRPPDPRAGYTLLAALQQQGISIPFIIFSGPKAREHNVEAQRRGALGSTNGMEELLNFIRAALPRGPSGGDAWGSTAWADGSGPERAQRWARSVMVSLFAPVLVVLSALP